MFKFRNRSREKSILEEKSRTVYNKKKKIKKNDKFNILPPEIVLEIMAFLPMSINAKLIWIKYFHYAVISQLGPSSGNYPVIRKFCIWLLNKQYKISGKLIKKELDEREIYKAIMQGEEDAQDEFVGENISDYTGSAECYYDLGQSLEKLKLINITRLGKKVAFLYNGVGIAYFNIDAFTEAGKYFRKALKSVPDNQTFLYNYIDSLYMLGQYQTAINYYKNYPNSLAKDYVKTINKIGLCHFELKEYAKAKNCYEKALKLAPGNKVFLFNYVNSLYVLGQYQTVINYYKNYPNYLANNDADIINKIGLCYLKLKEYAKAKNCCEKALKLAPDNQASLYNYICGLFELGKYQAAINYYKNYPNYLAKDHVITINKIGLCHFKLKEYAKAKNCYEKVLKSAPDNQSCLYNYINSLYMLGQYQAAINYYKNYPNYSAKGYVKTINKIGLCHFELKKYAKAKNCYEKALKLAPGNKVFLFNYVNSLYRLGQYQTAINYYKNYPNYLAKDYVKTINKIGLCHFKLKEYAKAKNCYEKALKLAPNNQALLFSYIITLFYLEQYVDIIKYSYKSKEAFSICKAYYIISQYKLSKIKIKQALAALSSDKDSQEFFNLLFFYNNLADNTEKELTQNKIGESFGKSVKQISHEKTEWLLGSTYELAAKVLYNADMNIIKVLLQQKIRFTNSKEGFAVMLFRVHLYLLMGKENKVVEVLKIMSNMSRQRYNVPQAYIFLGLALDAKWENVEINLNTGCAEEKALLGILDLLKKSHGKLQKSKQVKESFKQQMDKVLLQYVPHKFFVKLLIILITVLRKEGCYDLAQHYLDRYKMEGITIQVQKFRLLEKTGKPQKVEEFLDKLIVQYEFCGYAKNCINDLKTKKIKESTEGTDIVMQDYKGQQNFSL
ncbi:MAG: tetratricopeptide repeat protein [Gammaproteobacteria bacterium]